MTALKTLVLTSTPSTPNKHLHPQIDTTNSKKKESSRPFWKTHRRSTSHHEFTKETRGETDEGENGHTTQVRCFMFFLSFNICLPFWHRLDSSTGAEKSEHCIKFHSVLTWFLQLDAFPDINYVTK